MPGPVLPVAGALGSVVVWRAVTTEELASIREAGAYSLGPGNIGKYFFPTRAQAENFAELMTKAGLGDYTITQGQVSESVLAESSDGIYVAGEGSGFFVLGETAVADIELVAILE